MLFKFAGKTILSIFLGTTLFFLVVRPAMAKALSEDIGNEIYNSNDIEIGTEIDDKGYSQIKIKNIHTNEVRLITASLYPNESPSADDIYIAWMGQVGSKWQIFFHNITTDKTIQLTNSAGNNVNPKVSGTYIVWEGQVNGIWQIFLFDGIRVSQITNSNTPCQSADIENDYIVYTRKNAESGNWNAYLYSISAKDTLELSPDIQCSNLVIEKGLISWIQNEKGITKSMQYGTKSMDFLESENSVTETEEISEKEVDFNDDEIVDLQEKMENLINSTEPSIQVVTEEDIVEELALDNETIEDIINETQESTQSEIIQD